MQVIWAETALTPTGWQAAVRVEIDPEGRIARVTPDSPAEGIRVPLLLPAPANAHSHAFQRAMAGLTEARGPDPRDSFWTWRRLMFRFLDALDPDQVQAIAAFVQMEMLEAGYAANVEFHYLHHRPGGAPYARLGEMSERIAAAAETSGIGLTLLPVLYQHGGCDRRPLAPGQLRFGNDIDRFAALVEQADAALAALPADAVLGVAPHSLRAVAPESFAGLGGLAPAGPIHMHLAEQRAEVAEVEAAWGARPVDWTLEHVGPDPRWCLIHCTQMTPDETLRLAAIGAVAGLCPITEANLGDGIFDGVRWMGAGGRIAIGSDSNLRIGLTEELRSLDHSQRLRDGSRAALATARVSTGRRLFEAACTGGAQAAGRASGRIAAGLWADLVALDTDNADLEGLQGDTLLDAWIFAGSDRMVRDTWSAGRHLVQARRHHDHDAITGAYRQALRRLREAA
ncbi:formimidoylglutamate deiminase [Frigidibacter sp. ROC022]|uniref:formimidoylglutamate deiminase n=1 Tax=Frigidibacter sp. ROC022 TaxID=2971796 RepID=UPI00215ADE83|nr:formimidoylglutamate deiminase [Frigidibacter sp. ROC022]MCR8722840.1 formimidoylglutamate deiminase [Frigidibacter sp. ROC022]